MATTGTPLSFDNMGRQAASQSPPETNIFVFFKETKHLSSFQQKNIPNQIALFPSQKPTMSAILPLFASPPKLPIFSPTPSPHPITTSIKPPTFYRPITKPISSRPDFRVWADDGDADSGGPDDYDMDEDEVEEVDNKKDFDVDYDTTTAISAASAATGGAPGGEDDIVIVQSKSFVSTQGWDSEKIVDYRINEEEFHKICLLDCDFFIRKPPDPDDDVYDFREVGNFFDFLVSYIAGIVVLFGFCKFNIF